MQEKGQKCKNSDANLYTKKQAVIACLSRFLLKSLISNVLFPYTSPTYAAAFVIGGNTNGLADWKTKDNISLKDIIDK